MYSDTDGESWRSSWNSSLLGDGIADLPDPGCKGSIARWDAGRALVASNVQDNGDPGGPEQDPRFNLTVSLSTTNGRTWPHRVIVWPAHRGAVGYSSVKVARDGTIAVHFDSNVHDSCFKLLVLPKFCGRNGTLPPKADCIACGLRHREALTASQSIVLPGGVRKGDVWCAGARPPRYPGWQPNADEFLSDLEGACTPLPEGVSAGGSYVALLQAQDVLRSG